MSVCLNFILHLKIKNVDDVLVLGLCFLTFEIRVAVCFRIKRKLFLNGDNHFTLYTYTNRIHMTLIIIQFQTFLLCDKIFCIPTIIVLIF